MAISKMLAAWTLVLLAGCGHGPRLDIAPDAEGDKPLAADRARPLGRHPGFARVEAENELRCPHATLESGGARIDFLAPYDPRRISVLFVHGIGGTPRDFRTMLDGLDRTRFQARVLYYPTGSRLHTVSHALHGILAELHRKHQFDTLFIAAHSMGGFVSRGFLVEALRDRAGGYARQLVTFSSPWEGHAWAKVGAQFTPRPPGPRIDLSPEGDFVVSLREPLVHVPHYVFFGFRRSPSLITRQSSDGVIALASQLPGWIQEQAEHCWGYDADHVGILSHPAARWRFNALLTAEADRLRTNRLPATI